MSADRIQHTAPKSFPPASMAVINVPSDFSKVIAAAAIKNDVDYETQLIDWAVKGAECARQHQPKEAGRKNRK